MSAITDPLVTAGLIFAIGLAAIALVPHVEGEMEGKLVFRFLLGPLCLAVVILFLAGVANNLYLVRWAHF